MSNLKELCYNMKYNKHHKHFISIILFSCAVIIFGMLTSKTVYYIIGGCFLLYGLLYPQLAEVINQLKDINYELGRLTRILNDSELEEEKYER